MHGGHGGMFPATHEAGNPHLDKRRQRILTVTGTRLASGLPIAVFENSASIRELVFRAVRTLHREVLAFHHLGDLMNALGAGARFGAVLAGFGGDQKAALSGARTLRQATGSTTPMLLVLRPEQLVNADSFDMAPGSDFVVVPCDACEIVARVCVAMKAIRAALPSEATVFGRYRFEPRAREVHIDQRIVRLQPKEFDLALFLFRHAGIGQTRETLFEIGRPEHLPGVKTRALDVHMARIRKKLGLYQGNDAQLSAIYGRGYVLYLRDAC